MSLLRFILISICIIEGIGIVDDPHKDADVSVLLTRKTPKSRKISRLFPIRYVPVCSKKHYDKCQASGIEIINSAPLLLHKARPDAWKHWAENAGVPEVKPEKIIFVDNMFALARAAEQGVGVALLPLPVSQDWINSGALVPLHDTHLVTEDFYWISINGASKLKKPALLFFQWMLEKFAIHS